MSQRAPKRRAACVPALDADPEADWFGESADYWDADYASTADPGSEPELSDSDLERDSVPGSTPCAPAVVSAAGGTSVCASGGSGAPKSSVGGSRPAAPAISHAQHTYTRRIVEFCCGKHSRIGARAPADCEVIRLTITDDLTTQAGLQKALSAVTAPGVPTLLFGAIPCTGGSPYQFLNWRLGPATRAKIRKHRAIFRLLWRHFCIVADACLANGGQIAIEWPRSCTYWRDRSVKSRLKRWGCKQHHLDGCMYGLVSQQPATRGTPLRKPWTIASTASRFEDIGRRCDGQHAHVRTQGRDTKLTESYTDALADGIHACWRNATSSAA